MDNDESKCETVNNEISVKACEEVSASAEDSASVAPVSKKSAKESVREFFTTSRIAYMAVFTAFSYVLYMPFFEFAIVPMVDFLKIDFSNVFVMIAGFSLGPVSAMVVGVLKEILHALTFSSTVGIGELANIIVMLPYILIPSVVYRKRKGIKTVLITLLFGCIGQTLISYPVNLLLNFPFYFGFDWQAGMSFFFSLWYWVLLFNFIKTLLISAVVLILYKPLSRLIKMINGKFALKKRVG